MEEQDTPTFNIEQMPRYRTGGYGAMVEDEDGQYVRVDDVLELLNRANGLLNSVLVTVLEKRY